MVSAIPNSSTDIDLYQGSDDQEDDHGDDIDSATELPLDTLTPGIINHDDDVDYFRLELSEETLVSFGNIPEGEVYPLRGNQFDLLDRDGDEIKHGFFGNGTPAAGHLLRPGLITIPNIGAARTGPNTMS